jgi:hypothetical protein
VALLDLFKRSGAISFIDLYDLCYLDGLTKKLDVELVRKKFDDYSLHPERDDFVNFVSGVTENAYRFEPTLSRYLPRSERRGVDERKILSEIPDLFLEVMRGLKL